MDEQRFDTLIRRMMAAPLPRHDLFRLIAGAVVAGLVTGAGFGPQPAAAAACKKVDQPCRRARQCCSNLCRGKRGKKTCRGHGAGTCKRGQGVCTAPNPQLLTCNNRSDCGCFLTTSGTSFCHELNGAGGCVDCERDADCVKLGFPRGSACAPVSAGQCAGLCPSGRFCLVRCGTVSPPP